MTSRRVAVVSMALCLVAGCASAPLAVRPSGRGGPPARRFVVAHRGAHLASPENSLEAIRDTARFGADFAEIDVRTTRDDALVIMHDGGIDRTTSGEGEVAQLTLAELREVRLDRPDGTRSAEPVPSLAEVLETAKRAQVRLYLDVKNVTPERLARALAGTDARHVLVYQDDLDWLERFHALAPDVPLLPDCSSASAVREAAERFGARAFASELDRFEPEHAEAAHAVGGVIIVDVLGLDEDLERRVREAFERGADAVQTDDPARVRALLERTDLAATPVVR